MQGWRMNSCLGVFLAAGLARRTEVSSAKSDVQDRAAAAAFLREPWGLIDAGTRGGTTWLRATSDATYVVAVREAPVSTKVLCRPERLSR